MFRSANVRGLWGLCCILLIGVLVVSCTLPSASDDQAPALPSSLTIDNNEDNGDGSTEDQPEPVDSFIKTTEVLQAEDGSAVLLVTTQKELAGGTYQARFYGEDGSVNTAPCEQAEGSDNQLQCSLALGSNPHEFEDGFMDTEVQIWGLDLGGDGVDLEGGGSNVNPTADFFEPVFQFDAGVDFTGTALSLLFDQIDLSVLPPEFELPEPIDLYNFNIYVSKICADWSNLGEQPDSLDLLCSSFYLDPLSVDPMDIHEAANQGFKQCPIWMEFETCNQMNAATMPDPDCEGKDAGSFWCQGTEEEPYIAGMLATACLQQISTAFEDPLTAFEDPLTAFEDPLTAFEDPLTAFEDPLTAFEDPLTAFEDPLTAFEDPLTATDVARTTILYKLAANSLVDLDPFSVCNYLAALGDKAMMQRFGLTLLEFYGQGFPIFKPISDRVPLDTADLMVMPAHCARFDEMEFYSFGRVYLMSHSVLIKFRANEPLPGVHYFVFGDPAPYHYHAEIGGASNEVLTLIGETDILFSWRDLPESSFGQDQEYALYVTGCEEPLATGVLSFPDYNYSRCEFYEDVAMSLHIADPSPNLSIYIAMVDGVPGLEVPDYSGYDNLDDTYFKGHFCGEQVICDFFDSFPRRVYCNMTVSPGCLGISKQFNFYVNQCSEPILSQMITIVQPSGGGGGGVSSTPTPACTGSEPNRNVCEGHGGTWTGASNTVGICTCP